jgi:DNA polymerase alpha-associated DNA helicase A
MQGREKDAVIISIVRSNETVSSFSFFFLMKISLLGCTAYLHLQREVGFLKEKRRLNGELLHISILAFSLTAIPPHSRHDACKTTSGKLFYSRPPAPSVDGLYFQCVVGDSATVCYGGKYLKRWLAWLEQNADVRYAGLE